MPRISRSITPVRAPFLPWAQLEARDDCGDLSTLSEDGFIYEKKLPILVALVVASLTVVSPVAACSKNFLGLCSGDCPPRTPQCSTVTELDGTGIKLVCKCTKRTSKNSSVDAEVEAGEKDPILDELIAMTTGE